MTGETTYDAVVVGASAAGCTAATLYARQGLKVALVDRESSPDYYKKICNHFIQPFAVHTFKRLGIVDALEAAGALRNGDIRVYTRWGLIHATPDSRSTHQPHGYNIRRLKLDPMLRAMAAGTAGVDFMPGLTARQLLAHNGRFSGVVLDNKQGQTQEIRARVVVGADGRNSRIAAASGVRTNVKPNNRFCYYAYYVNFSFPSQMIWFNEPNWIYAFPNDDGVTVLCSYIHKRHLPDFKRDLKTSFRGLYQGLPNGPEFDGVGGAPVSALPCARQNGWSIARRRRCSPVAGLRKSTRRCSTTRTSIGQSWVATLFRSPITRPAADSIRLKNSSSWRRCTIR